MRPDRDGRPPTYSTARIDSLVCPVLVDRRQLQSCLPNGRGLSLTRLRHVPQGYHPVIVEIWRVNDGLIEFGGLTAHGWWELAGSVAGFGVGGSAGVALGAGMGGAAGAASGGAAGKWLGPWGAWWGAGAGATWGAAVGAATTATLGAIGGAHLAAEAGRILSETNSRVIGTYNEIIVTVPCRLADPQCGARDFAFVLATYTDSLASILGEWFVGWGYRKSEVSGVRDGDGHLEVSNVRSGVLLRLAGGEQSPPLSSAALRSIAPELVASLTQPLLGLLPSDQLQESFLDRSFETPSVQVTPVSVRLESSDGLLPGLRGVVSKIDAIGRRNPWGAFAVSGLPVRLSYPRGVDH